MSPAPGRVASAGRQQRRVLLTGATGRLGRVALTRLVAAGFAVRAMSRRPRPPRHGAEWVVADLASGQGVVEAVTGADAVVHLASAPYRGRHTIRVDLDGTRRLLAAAADSGISHLLFLSIVGVDRVPWGFFQTKLRVEELIGVGAVPWSIIRATQFHDFVDQAFRVAARLPVMVTDPAIAAQPADVRDVADRITHQLRQGPSTAVEDFGGPEVLTGVQPLRQWLDARGIRRPILRASLPGRLGAAFRAGHLTTAAQQRGTITWGQYLAEAYARPAR